MSIQFENFLLLSGVVTALILLYLFKGGKRSAPTRLNLVNKGNAQSSLSLNVESQSRSSIDIKSSDNFESNTQKVNEKSYEKERDLNVIFMYNGEEWDAYQVLGLPAGCQPEQVKQAYQQELLKEGDKIPPIFTAAYNAIMKKVG